MARLILNNDLVFRRSAGESRGESRVLGRGFIEGCRWALLRGK